MHWIKIVPKLPIFLLISLLGNDDFKVRELGTNILINSDNNDDYEEAELQSIKNNDAEIRKRCEFIVENRQYYRFDKIINSYPFLPQIDMFDDINHNYIFWGYRTKAINKGYKSKWPLFIACRKATYLYLDDVYNNKNIYINEYTLRKELRNAYIREFKWYLWIYLNIKFDDFKYWHKPTF